MRAGTSRFALAVAMLAACSMAHPAAAEPPPWQPVPPAPAARATTGIALPVGKCVNLGNTLEPPREAGWGGRPFRDSDATNIRQAGFATVRLPVRFSGHAGDSPPYRDRCGIHGPRAPRRRRQPRRRAQRHPEHAPL